MRVCIVGAGNIGMRYVQGITAGHPDVELILVDREERLEELKDMDLGDARLLESIDEIRGDVDLCVVSTSCESRLSLYKQCLELDPRYVILEKYLFKSREEFEESLTLKHVPTFVNQWMYGSRTFDCLFEDGARSVELSGSGWGLACNAVHWIDVFKRHMNITYLQVGSGTTITDVFPSKRVGYEEITGELVFVDRDSDKTFKLVDRHDPELVNMQRIIVDDSEYIFDYSNIVDGDRILSHFPYFSELIGGIVGEIVNTGASHLPSLEESVSQHLLIEDILEKMEHRPRIT